MKDIKNVETQMVKTLQIVLRKNKNPWFNGIYNKGVKDSWMKAILILTPENLRHYEKIWNEDTILLRKKKEYKKGKNKIKNSLENHTNTVKKFKLVMS